MFSKTVLSKPAITITVGVLLFVSGLVAGRVPYTVPGGYRWNADQVGNICHLVSQATGHATATPTCVHAQELMVLAGALIVVGLILAATGIAVAVRRLRLQPEIPAQQ